MHFASSHQKVAYLTRLLLIAASAIGVFASYPAQAEVLPKTDTTDAVQAIETDHYFNLSREFPNYFNEVVTTQGIERAHDLLEKTITHIFRRLTVTIVDESGTPKQVRYFAYVQQKLSEAPATKDRLNNIELMVSGGVVRSALSYLYYLVHITKLSHPSMPTQTILERILEKQHDIDAFHVRGIGSDWDMLVRAPSEETTRGVQEIVFGITNSALERSLSGRKDTMNKDLARTFSLDSDINEYDAQMDEAVKQGGSTLDFLALDVHRGRFVLPSRHPSISRDFLRGVFEYVAPVEAHRVRDPDKQTIRGLRPFLEIPFLRLKDETQFRKDLMAAITSASKRTISVRAMEQFDKIARNVRFSAANNRFLRGRPGSLEAMVFQLKTAVQKATDRVVLPKFVAFSPPDARTQSQAKLKAVPPEFLIPISTFIQEHTQEGILFHGTSFQGALSILRGGLIESDSSAGQGASAFGPGGYATPEYWFAKSYANNAGLVLRLRIKANAPLRILNWDQVKDSEFIRNTSAIADAKNEHVFETLRRDYGIDIVINTYVILLNSASISPPALSELAATSLQTVFNKNLPLQDRFEALAQVNELLSSGLQDLLPTNSAETELSTQQRMNSHEKGNPIAPGRAAQEAMTGLVREILNNPRGDTQTNKRWYLQRFIPLVCSLGQELSPSEIARFVVSAVGPNPLLAEVLATVQDFRSRRGEVTPDFFESAKTRVIENSVRLPKQEFGIYFEELLSVASILQEMSSPTATQQSFRLATFKVLTDLIASPEGNQLATTGFEALGKRQRDILKQFSLFKFSVRSMLREVNRNAKREYVRNVRSFAPAWAPTRVGRIVQQVKLKNGWVEPMSLPSPDLTASTRNKCEAIFEK